jgi:hypothetical protein
MLLSWLDRSFSILRPLAPIFFFDEVVLEEHRFVVLLDEWYAEDFLECDTDPDRSSFEDKLYGEVELITWVLKILELERIRFDCSKRKNCFVWIKHINLKLHFQKEGSIIFEMLFWMGFFVSSVDDGSWTERFYGPNNWYKQCLYSDQACWISL